MSVIGFSSVGGSAAGFGRRFLLTWRKLPFLVHRLVHHLRSTRIMSNFRRSWLAALAFGLLLSSPVFAGYTPDPSSPREKVPAAYQWHLNDLFATDQAWQDEFDKVSKGIPTLAKWQGHVGDSAQNLQDCLDATNDFTRRIYKLWVYAGRKFDQDQSVDANQARKGRIEMIIPTFGKVTSYVNPEIVAIDKAKLDAFIAADPKLKVYTFYIDEVRRLKDHTLSPPEEKILALTANMGEVPGNTHGALMNVDLSFGKLKDDEGKEVDLNQTAFTRLRGCKVYDVRKQATDMFFAGLRSHENTFASLIDGVVKAHILNKDARGYASCLEAALTPNHLSTKSYTMLVDTVNANLPRTMHKYIALRKKVMGLDGKVTFPNLYNALLPAKEIPYTYEEGEKLILEAFKPMGKEYLDNITKGMNPANGWVDVYPNAKKDSGAYMSGEAYDAHPFVLLNFTNTMDDVFTTAHEFGHAMHSVYSNKNQPFVYANYTTFLAEIASTANEEILLGYMLKQAKDPDTRLLLLNQRLENIRLTIFRQTMFAEFEKRFHEYAEKGEPLTADVLDGIYKELITKYYGPDYEMGKNDDVEWAFIPHFYYNFYVFSYATGLTSGISIARQIEAKGGEKAAQRYINEMLKAGSSAPPLEILKKAGVDLETPEPIVDAMNLFEQTIADFDSTWTKAHGAQKK
jgi:oligoendopeptidase F